MKGGVINTGTDIAGKTLAHIMGETMKPMNLDYNKNGQLYVIDVSKSLTGDHRILNFGYIYIPEKCLKETCKTHMWFHGCGGTAAWYGAAQMRATGILEHASANEFIAIFLQSDNPNEEECWASDLTQEINHPQLQSMRKVLKDIFDSDVLQPEDDGEEQVSETVEAPEFLQE